MVEGHWQAGRAEGARAKDEGEGRVGRGRCQLSGRASAVVRRFHLLQRQRLLVSGPMRHSWVQKKLAVAAAAEAAALGAYKIYFKLERDIGRLVRTLRRPLGPAGL